MSFAAMPSFVVDLPTLFAVIGFTAVTGGLLLLFSWLQRRGTPALALWGGGYLLAASSAALIALRGQIPPPWSVCIAVALLCCAYGLIWAGSRSFEGRTVQVRWIFAGAVVWIAACQFDGVYDLAPTRVMIGSAILAVYAIFTAREVWYARDRELTSRWPTLGLLIFHAGFLTVRIPMASALTISDIGDPASRPALSIVAFESLFVVFCLAFLRMSMAKERAELEQRRAAFTDALTGVANRRAFFDRGEALLERTVADRRTAAMLLFDLDRFKEVNDTAGHQCGDGVLRAFATLVTATMRPGDLFGRVGGEEFACLLVDVSMTQALKIAEQVRSEFAALRFSNLETGVTVSTGISLTGETVKTLPTLLAIADRALYRAKAEGRNRVAPAPLVLVDTGEREAIRLTADIGRPVTSAVARL